MVRFRNYSCRCNFNQAPINNSSSSDRKNTIVFHCVGTNGNTLRIYIRIHRCSFSESDSIVYILNRLTVILLGVPFPDLAFRSSRYRGIVISLSNIKLHSCCVTTDVNIRNSAAYQLLSSEERYQDTNISGLKYNRRYILEQWLYCVDINKYSQCKALAHFFLQKEKRKDRLRKMPFKLSYETIEHLAP